MSILIRDVNKELYTKIKAYAISRGIKVGQVMDEAMNDWLNKQEGINKDEEMIKNEVAFNQIQSTLERDHQGKWALICNGSLITIQNTLQNLIREKNRKGLNDIPSLTVHIGKKPRKINLTLRRIKQ